MEEETGRTGNSTEKDVELQQHHTTKNMHTDDKKNIQQPWFCWLHHTPSSRKPPPPLSPVFSMTQRKSIVPWHAMDSAARRTHLADRCTRRCLRCM